MIERRPHLTRYPSCCTRPRIPIANTGEVYFT